MNFLNPSNKFGYDEIVDTFVDVITALVAFLALWQGKFNLMAFLNWAMGNYPRIQEAVNDFGTFTKQLGDLTAEESKAAAAEIANQVPNDKVAQRIARFLTGLALLHGFVLSTVNGATGLYGYFKDTFSRQPAKA